MRLNPQMLLPLLLFASCSDEADFNISKASSLKPAVEMTSSMTLQLSTDKALYALVRRSASR